MKINIHTDQFVDLTASRSARGSQPAQVNGGNPITNSAITKDNVNSALDSTAAIRSARVSNLAALFASGRYVVNSAQLAQSIVSGALTGR